MLAFKHVTRFYVTHYFVTRFYVTHYFVTRFYVTHYDRSTDPKEQSKHYLKIVKKKHYFIHDVLMLLLVAFSHMRT